MKLRYFIFLIITFSFTLNSFALGEYILKDSSNVFLMISFQNLDGINNKPEQSRIKTKIEEIFKNEGYHIIQIERPERYKMNINITVKDSLIIYARGTGVSDGIIIIKYPRESYAYKNESDIYKCIKTYIKKYLK